MRQAPASVSNTCTAATGAVLDQPLTTTIQRSRHATATASSMGTGRSGAADQPPAFGSNTSTFVWLVSLPSGATL
jgi:hypothetical protein